MADLELKGKILKETDMAVLFSDGIACQVWLPKSQIAIIREIEGVTVVVPEWLAEAKGMA
ncbi:MAG: hypothetical protein JRG72_11155 [Deltaproteobacteria bacterium]|nr:hypothetical protein [Deltaproteobacteria bacterium]